MQMLDLSIHTAEASEGPVEPMEHPQPDQSLTLGGGHCLEVLALTIPHEMVLAKL